MSNELPKNLLGAMRYLADPDVCLDFVAAMRWPGGVTCPHCGGDRVSYLTTRRIWKCMNGKCHRQFSAKVGTIFEESPIPLDKWMVAVWMIVNCKNGVSSWELHRAIKVTQKTAWFMLHRVRLSMQDRYLGTKLDGEIEADETYIGGKVRNMHLSKRAVNYEGKPNRGKAIVLGVLERGGQRQGQRQGEGQEQRERQGQASRIRTSVVPNLSRPVLQGEVRKHVKAGAAIYTDSMHSYTGLSPKYMHQIVDHAVRYVDGRVHTNGLENFWSLLKRGIGGTYVSVEPFHLFRYLDEQAFRFNNRATKDNPLDDRDRFMLAVSQIANKRLTYADLTGKGRRTQEQPF
jgi:transposase-like protein